MNKGSWLRNNLCTAIACTTSLLCGTSTESYADYTRVNSVSNIKLADVQINCDFRVRFLAGNTSNNSYKITYVSQNATQGYIMEAPLTNSQVQELLKVPNFLSSRSPVVIGTPAPGSTHSLRVVVPLMSGGPAVTLVSGGQTFPIISSVLDLEKQCATTTAVSAQAGGSDGCAMLAFKQGDGSCRCAVDPLASSNPCAELAYRDVTKTCVQGPWDPNTRQPIQKCIGPVSQQSGSFYFFNSQNCACEFCDPTVATRGADASSCTCKFSNFAEVMATQSPPRPPASTGTALDALKERCSSLEYQSSPPYQGGMPSGLNRSVFFDKRTCSCSICPQGFVANADQSGCVKM